ncbi:MAG: exosortase system-associated protein, TIGR04073 family [Candidatus Omnitrophica bacterium]|nr:exosortase system-associated protein, TIGR04073 family [Candidatus Omnitrophota bacterium]MDD5430179.1 exosortase system-associated protein, TIGR04073 family [Candidatus Omnitrophota bacterium]
MVRTFVALVLTVVVLGCAGSAYAMDQNAATKLARGICNDVTFWIEVPKQVYLEARDRDPLTGLTYGMVKGIGYGIMRLGEGIYDTALFLLPPYDRPLMEPEFVFEGWVEE